MLVVPMLFSWEDGNGCSLTYLLACVCGKMQAVREALQLGVQRMVLKQKRTHQL